MAAVVPENWPASFDDNNVDFSEVDSSLFMSILDDTQGGVGEDYDDERLRSVIRSLEAEIDGHTTIENDYDFIKDNSQTFDDDSNKFINPHFSELGALDDLKLMEMEIEMESSFSIPNEGVVNSWFVDYPNCENHSKMDGLVENGDGYEFLWQETNTSIFRLN